MQNFMLVSLNARCLLKIDLICLIKLVYVIYEKSLVIAMSVDMRLRLQDQPKMVPYRRACRTLAGNLHTLIARSV